MYLPLHQSATIQIQFQTLEIKILWKEIWKKRN